MIRTRGEYDRVFNKIQQLEDEGQLQPGRGTRVAGHVRGDRAATVTAAINRHSDGSSSLLILGENNARFQIERSHLPGTPPRTPAVGPSVPAEAGPSSLRQQFLSQQMIKRVPAYPDLSQTGVQQRLPPPHPPTNSNSAEARVYRDQDGRSFVFENGRYVEVRSLRPALPPIRPREEVESNLSPQAQQAFDLARGLGRLDIGGYGRQTGLDYGSSSNPSPDASTPESTNTYHSHASRDPYAGPPPKYPDSTGR